MTISYVHAQDELETWTSIVPQSKTLRLNKTCSIGVSGVFILFRVVWVRLDTRRVGFYYVVALVFKFLVFPRMMGRNNILRGMTIS